MKRWILFYMFNFIFYLALPITYYVMGLFERDIVGLVSLAVFKVLAFIPMVALSVVAIIVLIVFAVKNKFKNKSIVVIVFCLILTILEGMFLILLGAPMFKWLYLLFAVAVIMVIYQTVMLCLKTKVVKEKKAYF